MTHFTGRHGIITGITTIANVAGVAVLSALFVLALLWITFAISSGRPLTRFDTWIRILLPPELRNVDKATAYLGEMTLIGPLLRAFRKARDERARELRNRFDAEF